MPWLPPPKAQPDPPVTELMDSAQEGATAELGLATYRSANARPRLATSAVSSPTRVGMISAIVETPAKALTSSGQYKSGVMPQLLSITARLMPPLRPAPAQSPDVGSSPNRTASVE